MRNGKDVQMLVCGSRTFEDIGKMMKRLEEASLCYFYGEDIAIVHGGARGADQMAGIVARRYGWEIFVEPAQWDKYGKAAGAIRNQAMLDKYDPYLVAAFPHGPLSASRGTLDMVTRAAQQEVLTIVY